MPELKNPTQFVSPSNTPAAARPPSTPARAQSTLHSELDWPQTLASLTPPPRTAPPLSSTEDWSSTAPGASAPPKTPAGPTPRVPASAGKALLPPHLRERWIVANPSKNQSRPSQVDPNLTTSDGIEGEGGHPEDHDNDAENVDVQTVETN